MSIFTHAVLGTNDLAQGIKFYDATLGTLGLKNLGAFGDNGRLYGAEGPEFIVTKPANGQPASSANGGTLGFLAPTRDAVEAFHLAGLANGGMDEGAPVREALLLLLTLLICVIRRVTKFVRTASRHLDLLGRSFVVPLSCPSD